MLKRFINFGSIEQMPAVIRNVRKSAQFVGLDEDGKAIFDEAKKAAPVLLTLSEKIHGTQGAVCYSTETKFYVQSRKNIITPEKDNAGFAFWAKAHEEELTDIIQRLAEEYNIDLTETIVTLFGEWAGGNIQKNACVSGLPKQFFIFQHFKVSPLVPLSDSDSTTEPSKWYETCYKTIKQDPYDDAKVWVDKTEDGIYNVMNFQHWNMELDFERPDIARNKIIELVEKIIEPNSPLGCELGKEKNTGEGIVATFLDSKRNLMRFKIKGDKHCKGTGKIKKLKPVDSALEQAKIDFVNKYASSESRFQQMWTEIVHSTHNGDEDLMEMKNMGTFIRLVIADVIKENSTEMSKMGLEPKMINSMISAVARNFFKSKLDENAGLK